MNKRLIRLLRPNTGMYFLLLLVFSAAALLKEQYILAGAELAVTVLAFLGYIMFRNYRHRKIESFVLSMENAEGAPEEIHPP